MSAESRALESKDRVIDSLQRHLDWFKDRFPCVGCSDAPEEDCPRHGRTPSELWEAIGLLQHRLMGSKPGCPDCEAGKVDGVKCATCDEADFDWRVTAMGTVRLVRRDLPAIADEEAYAIYLEREDLERISVALRLDDLCADRAGEV